MNKILAIVFLLGLNYALADEIKVKGMHCHSCENQVIKSICKDAEISTWMDKCDASVVDADKEMGVLKYTLKKGVTLTSEQKAKISDKIKAGGREVIEDTKKTN